MMRAQVTMFNAVAVYSVLLCWASTTAQDHTNDGHPPSADTLKKLFDEEICDSNNHSNSRAHIRAMLTTFHEGYGIDQDFDSNRKCLCVCVCACVSLAS